MFIYVFYHVFYIIAFNCVGCHYEVNVNTTVLDHMHLVHKRYTTNQFLTGVLNMIILSYSENPLETRPEVYSSDFSKSQSVLVN